MGRFHQTLCAKQKFASAQQLAKKTPFNFINNIYANYVSRNLPNLSAVRQTPFATKSVQFCKRKHLAKIIRQKFDEKVGRKSWALILMKSTPGVSSFSNVPILKSPFFSIRCFHIRFFPKIVFSDERTLFTLGRSFCIQIIRQVYFYFYKKHGVSSALINIFWHAGYTDFYCYLGKFLRNYNPQILKSTFLGLKLAKTAFFSPCYLCFFIVFWSAITQNCE